MNLVEQRKQDAEAKKQEEMADQKLEKKVNQVVAELKQLSWTSTR